MRLLKNKIRLAQEALQKKQQKTFARPIKQLISSEQQEILLTGASETRTKRSCAPYAETILASTFTKPMKNIIINYGKAILSFAMSDIAKEYIERYFSKEELKFASFNQFATQLKPKISGYKNFEAIFVIDETDSEEIVLFRRILKMLGVVFMKYFSVNWIFHGKIAHKQVYLQNRFSILRRITKGQDSLF